MPGLLKKSLVCMVMVIAYFLGVREIRYVVRDIHVGTVLPAEFGEISENLFFYQQSNAALKFANRSSRGIHARVYKIPFGVFFLLGMFGLVFIDAPGKSYAFLISIHFLSGILSFFFMLIGVYLLVPCLIIPDLISRYLTPLCSLGLVVLTFVQQRKVAESES